MPHSYTSLLTHLVFSTKDRLPDIDADLAGRLHPYLGGIVRELDGKALAIGGAADHVHLLVSLPPTVAVSDALRDIKANSSRWGHETWPARLAFGWQTGYAAFSVSPSNREAVERYIADQQKHHRKFTFQEEFIALLEKHGVAYDPRYVWA